MGKFKFLFVAAGLELLVIAAVAAGCHFGGAAFYGFYNGGYGLLLSLLVPLLYAAKTEQPPADFGVRRLGGRQWLVLAAFVAFSIGGQSIPLLINKTPVDPSLLLRGFFPLAMTTLFEEFFFRGFLQTRLARRFGPVWAVLLSGLFFSLYHLGYPGFRTAGDIFLLFAVGVGFALAYTLAGNNLFVAYFVNLPNALLTYALKFPQFPAFDRYSAPFAAVTLALAGLVLFLFRKTLAMPARAR